MKKIRLSQKFNKKKNLKLTHLSRECLSNVFTYIEFERKFDLRKLCKLFYIVFFLSSSHYSLSQWNKHKLFELGLVIGKHGIREIRNFFAFEKRNKCLLEKTPNNLESVHCNSNEKFQLDHEIKKFFCMKSLRFIKGNISFSIMGNMDILIELSEKFCSFELRLGGRGDNITNRLITFKRNILKNINWKKSKFSNLKKIRLNVLKNKKLYFNSLENVLQTEAFKHEEFLFWNFLNNMIVPKLNKLAILSLPLASFERERMTRFYSSLSKCSLLKNIQKLKMIKKLFNLTLPDFEEEQLMREDEKFSFVQFQFISKCINLTDLKCSYNDFFMSEKNISPKLVSISTQEKVDLKEIVNLKILPFESIRKGIFWNVSNFDLISKFKSLTFLKICTNYNNLITLKNLERLESLIVDIDEVSNDSNITQFNFSKMEKLKNLNVTLSTNSFNLNFAYFLFPNFFLNNLKKLTLKVNISLNYKRLSSKIRITNFKIVCPKLEELELKKLICPVEVYIETPMLKKLNLNDLELKKITFSVFHCLKVVNFYCCSFEKFFFPKNTSEDIFLDGCKGKMLFEKNSFLKRLWVKPQVIRDKNNFHVWDLTSDTELVLKFVKTGVEENISCLTHMFGPFSFDFLKSFIKNNKGDSILKNIEYLELDDIPYRKEVSEFLVKNFPSLKRVNSFFLEDGKFYCLNKKKRDLYYKNIEEDKF